jgi:hypothetical protein
MAQLKVFNKEVSRRKVAPYTIWPQLEGLSLFLQLEYIDMWFRKSSHIRQSLCTNYLF